MALIFEVLTLIRWFHIPVDTSLPGGVVETVKDVQEHWAKITWTRPIHLRALVGSVIGHIIARVCYLEAVATTPDCEGEHEQHDPGDHSTSSPAETSVI